MAAPPQTAQRGGKRSATTNLRGNLPPQKPAAPRGGKSDRKPEVDVVAKPQTDVVANSKPSVVANSLFDVVANDEDDDETDQQIDLTPPNDASRIELRKRKRKNGYVYIIGWRWQVKENGQPCRTASGGYKRGFRYVKSVRTKKQADKLKAAARKTGRA